MSYKTIFIVDPIRGERIQMAKFLSEEIITVMTFVSINDCFKRPDLICSNLIVFAPRREKNEIKHLLSDGAVRGLSIDSFMFFLDNLSEKAVYKKVLILTEEPVLSNFARQRGFFKNKIYYCNFFRQLDD